MSKMLLRCTLASFVVILSAAFSFAGIITGAGAAVGPGLGTVAVPVTNSLSPGNDDVPGVDPDNNITVPIKRFDSNGIIDIPFSVVDNVAGSGGSVVTEYLVFESVDNNTGVNWASYNMQLGFGTGAAFMASPAGDGLDFDAGLYTPAPTSSIFPVVGLSEDLLVFSGSIHSTGMEIYQVRIDVPNGITGFTLRQFPVAVPEPSTGMLLVLGALAMVACRRRAPLS